MFQCLKCVSKPKFSTLGESILHQKCHINDKNFVFTCQWPSCGLMYLTYNALDMHARYAHSDLRHVPQDKSSPRSCYIPGCNLFFPSDMSLCRHLMKFHQLEQGLATQCPFREDCKSEHFFPHSSFKVHVSQKHKGWRTGGAGPSQQPQCNEHEDEMDFSDTADSPPHDNFLNTASNLEENEFNPNSSSQNTQETDYQQNLKEFYHSLSMFYLKLESVHQIPSSTVQSIAESLAQLSDHNLRIMKNAVERELEDLELTDDVKERITRKIMSSDCMFSAHHKDSAGPCKMSTKALRKSYFKKNFKYIKPKEINLSKDPLNPKHIYYVPISDSLQFVLRDPAIQEEIKASFERQSQEGIFQDFQDGSLYKKRKEKNANKSIDLLIFQDAFTPTKDLSSVSNLYQILGMYMTIGNLRPHLRSKLNCMQLIMLIPDFKTIFAEFKVNCFKRVVADLKDLEKTGISFQGETIMVQLHYLIGDNKGQHEIGGFIQSFSCEDFCRFCTMTRTEFRAEPWRIGALRSVESYETASLSVPRDRATFMGVSRPEWVCPFNALRDFHACDPSLPPCIGHDIFEGVISFDLSLVLKHFVEEEWFTYKQLNRKIRQFRYKGHDSGNKPAPLKFNKKAKQKKKKIEESLGGHAVQNWTLLRLLPFILDEELIINTEDEYWKLYVSLKEITELITAPSICFEQLSLLKRLLEEYAGKRKDLLGDGKPKHHYLYHYADLVQIMGPLIDLMTLRFESFHQFFKKTIRASNNFINIGLTSIKKYCMYISYLYAGSPVVPGIKIVEPGISVAIQMAASYDESLMAALETRNIGNQALIMRRIVFDELTFKTGQWIPLGNLDNEIVIAKIQSLVLDCSSVYLILHEHIATKLSGTGIYKINTDPLRASCLHIKEIKYPTAISIYQWGEHELCFSLKHTLLAYNM